MVTINIIIRAIKGLLMACLALLPCLAGATSIVNSPHNMSATTLNAVRASSETEVCIFCHTPHGGTAEAPLWNRYSAGDIYAPYYSTTAKAAIGQPLGASKLCLSCHDGTIALGQVRSRSTDIEFIGGILKMPPGRSNLGTDLQDDHPISFLYNDDLIHRNVELKDPVTLTGRVRLDRSGRLECTACHNPHDNQYGKFLVQSDVRSALCLVCHDKTGWTASSHATSVAVWNSLNVDPWPRSTLTTVAENGCSSCHEPHKAQHKQRLLNLDGEEQTCYVCHNGNVAAKNVQGVVHGKFSIHPIESGGTAGAHDPMEDPINPGTRHVECADCHNPHANNSAPAVAPYVSGALAGVRGVEANNTVVSPATKEYEICFRCHGNSLTRGPAVVTRQTVQTNTRLEFSPASQSYHPVEAAGKNADVPSLIPTLSVASLIYCSDCHNNNEGPHNGGTGPNGPHGSAYAPILERNLEMTDSNTESIVTYALCYKCHQQSSILANESFSSHRKHIVDLQTACTTCHDSHGVQAVEHLMNFNTAYVSASTNGPVSYVRTGFRAGSCTLSCHGIDHGTMDYHF